MIYLTLWPIIGIAIGTYRLRLSIKSYGPLLWHGYIVGAIWAAILGPAIPILFPPQLYTCDHNCNPTRAR